MKKLLTVLFFVLFIGVPVLLSILSIAHFCEPFVSVLGNGSVLRGLLLMPFGIFGMIQVIRGAGNVFNLDMEKINSMKESEGVLLGSLYIVVSLVSYCCFYIVLTRLLLN